MNSDIGNNERGQRCIASLFHCEDEDKRVAEFRALVRHSRSDDWARDTVVQVYRLVGTGECDRQIDNMCNTQMLLTSIEENPALLPLIEADIENLICRLEALGTSFRGTWQYVRSKLSEPSLGHAAHRTV